MQKEKKEDSRDEGYGCYNANVNPFLLQCPVHRIGRVSFAIPRHDVAVVDLAIVDPALVDIVCDLTAFLLGIMLLPVHGFQCCVTEGILY